MGTTPVTGVKDRETKQVVAEPAKSANRVIAEKLVAEAVS